jgi:hypothetical protein
LTAKATVEAMHAEIMGQLPIDDIVVCFHADADNCACRRPKPGMILEAAAKHGIDLASSYLVGDRWRDVHAGRNASCRTIFVDTAIRRTSPLSQTNWSIPCARRPILFSSEARRIDRKMLDTSCSLSGTSSHVHSIIGTGKRQDATTTPRCIRRTGASLRGTLGMPAEPQDHYDIERNADPGDPETSRKGLVSEREHDLPRRG